MKASLLSLTLSLLPLATVAQATSCNYLGAWNFEYNTQSGSLVIGAVQLADANACTASWNGNDAPCGWKLDETGAIAISSEAIPEIAFVGKGSEKVTDTECFKTFEGRAVSSDGQSFGAWRLWR